MPVSEKHFADVIAPAHEIKDTDVPNLDTIENRLLLTLDRVSIHLAKEASKGLPKEAELSALTQALKLVRDLKNKIIKEIGNLTDDELIEIIEKEKQHEEIREAKNEHDLTVNES